MKYLSQEAFASTQMKQRESLSRLTASEIDKPERLALMSFSRTRGPHLTICTMQKISRTGFPERCRTFPELDSLNWKCSASCKSQTVNFTIRWQCYWMSFTRFFRYNSFSELFWLWITDPGSAINSADAGWVAELLAHRLARCEKCGFAYSLLVLCAPHWFRIKVCIFKGQLCDNPFRNLTLSLKCLPSCHL